MRAHLQQELGALGGKLYSQLDHLAAGLQVLAAGQEDIKTECQDIKAQMGEQHQEVLTLLKQWSSGSGSNVPLLLLSSGSSGSLASPEELWALSDTEIMRLADKDGNSSITSKELSLFLSAYGLGVDTNLAGQLLHEYGKLGRAAQVGKMKKLLQYCWEAVQAPGGSLGSLGSSGGAEGEQEGGEGHLSKEQCRAAMLKKVGEDQVEDVLERVGDDEQVDFPRLTGLLLQAMERR
jgi:hypothetical protein